MILLVLDVVAIVVLVVILLLLLVIIILKPLLFQYDIGIMIQTLVAIKILVFQFRDMLQVMKPQRSNYI